MDLGERDNRAPIEATCHLVARETAETANRNIPARHSTAKSSRGTNLPLPSSVDLASESSNRGSGKDCQERAAVAGTSSSCPGLVLLFQGLHDSQITGGSVRPRRPAFLVCQSPQDIGGFLPADVHLLARGSQREGCTLQQRLAAPEPERCQSLLHLRDAQFPGQVRQRWRDAAMFRNEMQECVGFQVGATWCGVIGVQGKMTVHSIQRRRSRLHPIGARLDRHPRRPA